MDSASRSDRKQMTLYKRFSHKTNRNSSSFIPCQNDKSTVTIDLNKWKLLASGGAYWVFHMKDKIVFHTKINHPNKVSSAESPQCPVPNYNYCSEGIDLFDVQNGMYLFRVKQLKWLKKLIKIRTQLLIQAIQQKSKLFHKNLNQNQENEISNYSLQLEKLLDQSQKQLENNPPKGINPLQHLVEVIYKQFLCKNMHQNAIEGNPSQSQNSLLPHLSKSIVRQSQIFYFIDFNNQELKKQNIHYVSEFLTFLMKELLYEQLSIEAKQQKISLQLIELDAMVIQHFDKYPINLKFITSLIRLEQLFVTFEENQLSFHQLLRPTQSQQIDKKCCTFSCQELHCYNQNIINNDKNYKVTVGEVFQFKPKTILPDLYTEDFIDDFVQNIDSIQQTFASSMNKDKKDQKIKINKSNPLQASNKVEDQSESLSCNRKLDTIKLIQGTIDQEEVRNLKISSTRWFKKNCINQGKKKKNENPLFYFSPCITKQSQQTDQKIDFYHKKHLRKQQILCLKQIEKQQTSTQNTLIRVREQVEETITTLIHQCQDKNCQDTINIKTTDNFNKGLSIMEEILALQLIDVPEQIQSNNNSKKFIDQERNKNVGILEIQRLSQFFSELTLIKNCQDEKQNAHMNLNQQSSQLHQPTQILHLETQEETFTQSHAKMKRRLLNIHKNARKSNQKLYPSRGLDSIKSLFDPQVYAKSKSLSTLLRQIIFNDPQIHNAIFQTFSCFLSFNPNPTKLITQDKQQLIQSMEKIKQGLFYIVRYLVSLTWKDISFLVQEILSIIIGDSSIKLINTQKQQPQSIKKKQDQTEAMKEKIRKLDQQSFESIRKITTQRLWKTSTEMFKRIRSFFSTFTNTPNNFKKILEVTEQKLDLEKNERQKKNKNQDGYQLILKKDSINCDFQYFLQNKFNKDMIDILSRFLEKIR